MIKTIIFDIGNVLLKFDHTLAIQQVSKLTKIPIAQLHAFLLKSDNLRLYEAGEISTAQLMNELKCLGAATFQENDFIEAFSDIFQPIVETQALIPLLKEAGYRLTLLSNTNDAHWRFIESHYPIFQQFDAKTLSFEVESCKPNEGIFLDALKKSQCQPNECFYTDDISAYTQIAKEKYGIHSHTFKEPAKFIQELKNAGVTYA